VGKVAIYHLTAKTGSRGGGQSAKAKYCYVCREQEYSKGKEPVVFKASGNLPEWAVHQPKNYWRAADKFERANARLFKEIEFALPRELTKDQAIKLSTAFAEHLTATEKLPYSLAVHQGRKSSDLHCHVVISERVNDGLARTPETWFKRANNADPQKGGARKTDALKPKDWLKNTRAAWQDYANTALQLAGCHERIDHRSYKARGIDSTPQLKLGPSVVAMEEKGIRTEKGEKAIQRASMSDLRVIQKDREKALERFQNSRGEKSARTPRRSYADSRGHVSAGRKHNRDHQGVKPTSDGWFKKFVARFFPDQRSRAADGKDIREARLETLGASLSRHGRRVFDASDWLKNLGRQRGSDLAEVKTQEIRGTRRGLGHNHDPLPDIEQSRSRDREQTVEVEFELTEVEVPLAEELAQQLDTWASVKSARPAQQPAQEIIQEPVQEVVQEQEPERAPSRSYSRGYGMGM